MIKIDNFLEVSPLFKFTKKLFPIVSASSGFLKVIIATTYSSF